MYTLDEVNARIKSDPEMVALAKEDMTEFKYRAKGIYKEYGFNPDGSPMSKARQFVRQGAKYLGMDSDVAEFGAQAILPTVATGVGAAVGSAAGPIGTAGGAMVGSAFGEELNSAIGLTEPQDASSRAIALGAPLAGPVVGRAAKPLADKIVRRLPGSGAGLHQLAESEFTEAVTKQRVTKETVDLYRTQLDSIPDFDIPVPNLKALFTDSSLVVGKQAQQGVPGRSTYSDRIDEILIKNPGINNGRMSSKDLLSLEAGFNDIKSDYPGELWGAAAGKIIDDMEVALQNPKLTARSKDAIKAGLTSFRDFIKVNNKHKADESMLKAMQLDGPIIKAVKGSDGLVMFDRDNMRKFLTTNKDIKKAFTPEEIADMQSAVMNIGYLSKPPSNSFAPSNAIQRFGVGGTAGFVLGGGVYGGLAGAAMEETLRQAMMTDRGRRVVKYLAKNGKGKIDMLELDNMMGQMAAGASAGTVPGVTGKGNVPSTQGFANEE